MVAPIIEIQSVSRSKISNQSGMDRDQVTFRFDQNLAQFEARADGQGVGQGLLVESGTNLVTMRLSEISGTLNDVSTNYTDLHSMSWGSYTFYVDDEELTSGDKTYRINVYGKNGNGEWNGYEV